MVGSLKREWSHRVRDGDVCYSGRYEDALDFAQLNESRVYIQMLQEVVHVNLGDRIVLKVETRSFPVGAVEIVSSDDQGVPCAEVEDVAFGRRDEGARIPLDPVVKEL